MIDKTEFLDAVRDRRIVVAGRKYTKDGWTHFMPYLIRKEYKQGHDMLIPIIVPEAAYWNKKAHDYRCNAWGTNRVLEVFLSIGNALNCEFSEMSPQVSSIL